MFRFEEHEPDKYRAWLKKERIMCAVSKLDYRTSGLNVTCENVDQLPLNIEEVVLLRSTHHTAATGHLLFECDWITGKVEVASVAKAMFTGIIHWSYDVCGWAVRGYPYIPKEFGRAASDYIDVALHAFTDIQYMGDFFQAKEALRDMNLIE